MPKTLEEYYLSGITKENLHEIRIKKSKSLEEKIILITIYLDILEHKQARPLFNLVKLTLKKKKNISKRMKGLIITFLENRFLLIATEFSKILENLKLFKITEYALLELKERTYLFLLLFNRAEALFRLGNYSESQKTVDQILAISNNLEGELLLPKKVIEGLFYRISFMNYFYTGEVEKAEDVVFKGLKIYQEANNLTYQAYFHNFLGIIFTLKGNLLKGEESFHKSIELFESIAEPRDINLIKYTAGIYSNISSLLREQGRLKEAIEIALRALEIYTQLDQQVEIANCYNYLGMYYRDLREYELAEAYLFKGYYIRKKFKDPYEISESLVNICILEEKTNVLKFDSICINEFPTDQSSKIVHSNKLMIEALINFAKGKYEDALKNFNIILDTEGIDFSIRLLIMDYIAESLIETANYTKFSEWLSIWKTMAKENNLISSLFKAYLISFRFNMIFLNFDLAREDIENALELSKEYSTGAQRLVEQNKLVLDKRMKIFDNIKLERSRKMKDKNKEEELKELKLYIKEINSLLTNFHEK